MMLISKRVIKLGSVFLLLGLCACQANIKNGFNRQSVLYDEGFVRPLNLEIEDENSIFTLGDDAKHFVEKAISGHSEPYEQMEALVFALFNHSKFNLLYDGKANTVADETFKNRAANCLSLTILAYALAEEAGLGVQFQEIDIPEFWTRQNGFSLLNGHVNLRLIPKSNPKITLFQVQSYQVDFDPNVSQHRFAKHIVNKQQVLAMFYNNKGADALVEQKFDEAYAYFKQALKVSNNFNSAIINLGILYRLAGYYPQSELAYKIALSNDTESLTALENLAYLYQFTHRDSLANELLQQVENKRASNPYYHINIAEQAFELQQYPLAIAHYKNAAKLDKKNHAVYFGLARAYFKLGDLSATKRNLLKAKEYSENEKDENLYQNKLNLLSRL